MTRPHTAPPGMAERIAAAAAPELDALATRARRQTRLALLLLLGLPTLLAVWQFLELAARPAPVSSRPDARWLAQLVGPDGRFESPDGAARRATPVGLHGLALLALTRSDEDRPDGPTDPAAIARAAEWLLAQQAPDGGLADADQDHALGTVALVEAWQRTHAPDVRVAAEHAVACLLEREAWGGAHIDAAAAAWALEALAAAQDAGLARDARAAIDRTRARLVAELGGAVDPATLRAAALSPQATPRQAALGPLYVASVTLLAAAPPGGLVAAR